MKTMSMAEQLFLQPMLVQGQGLNTNGKAQVTDLFSGLLQQEETKLQDMSLQQEVLDAVDDLLASIFNYIIMPKSNAQLITTIESSGISLQDLTKRLQYIKISIQDGEISDNNLKKLQAVLAQLTQNLNSIESTTHGIEKKEELLKFPKLLELIQNDFLNMPKEVGKRISPLIKYQALATEQLVDSIGLQSTVSLNGWNEARSGDTQERQVPIQWLSKHLDAVFTRNVLVRSGQQVQEVILQLQPESLGKLDVMIQTQNGQLTAKFIVENQVARQAVEEQILHLKQSLQLQGVTVHNLEVVDSSNNYLPFQQQHRQHQEPRPFYSRGKKSREYAEAEEQLSHVKIAIQSRDETGINYTV